MQEDLQDLLERASRADQTAVDSLLERNLPGLRAFVRLRLGPLLRARETPDDLIQSVCREILENVDRFQYGSEAGFRSWLYATALRRIQKKHRYWKAQKRDAARDVSPPTVAKDMLTAYQSLSTPSGHLMAEEAVARIEATFDRLKEDEREVILLSRIVGLSHKEIGEQLGRSEGATRVLLHRALTRLAELLDEAD